MGPLRLLALLAVLVLALGVTACGDDEGSGESGQAAPAAEGGSEAKADGELKKVKFMLAYKDSISLLGLVIAKEKFYAEEGLEVESIPGQGGEYASQQLIAKNATWGLVGADSILIANSKGVPLRGIAHLGGRGIFTIIAPKGSDVKTMEDLKGKNLGVTDLGDGAIPLVRAAIAEAGLKEGKDVKLVPVGEGGPTALRAIETGQVAGFAGANNDLAGMEGAGLEYDVILQEKFRHVPSTHLAVLQEVLENEEDRDVAIRLARGWRKGADWARENPEEALEIACKRLPEECTDMKVAQAFIDKVLAAYEPPEGMESYANLEPKESYDLIQNTLAKAEITKPQNLDEVFPDDYLAEINSDG